MKFNTLGLLIMVVAFCHPISSMGQQPLSPRADSWTISTAYPADTASGRAASEFARTLQNTLHGDVQVTAQFKDKTVPATLSDDRAYPHFGVLFATDLADKEPILALSTRPYSVHSVAQALDMMHLATPGYRNALAHQGLVLLAVIPWPPTGIWSRLPIRSPSDLVGTRIRTYDESSQHVMAALGAQSVSLPIQQALDQLKTGQLDAILSSGDGDAGRAYAETLPNFTALRYAYPVSFLVAKKRFLDDLSSTQRAAIFQAGMQTQSLAWNQLPERVRHNYRSMAGWGVAIHDPAPGQLIEAVERTANVDTNTAIQTDYEMAQMLWQFRDHITRQPSDHDLSELRD